MLTEAQLEPCADVIESAAEHLSTLVSGARRRSKTIGGCTTWAAKFINFAYLFQKFFSKELLLSIKVCMLSCYFWQLSGPKFEIYFIKEDFSNKRLQNQHAVCIQLFFNRLQIE